MLFRKSRLTEGFSHDWNADRSDWRNHTRAVDPTTIGRQSEINGSNDPPMIQVALNSATAVIETDYEKIPNCLGYAIFPSR